MKKTLTTMVSVFLFLAAGAAVSDPDESEGPTFRPIEAFACNYNDGMGPADLDKVNAKWNAWMDDEGQDDYFAATMTPNYYGEWAFDVAWIGVWRDGNAMGTGTDMWLAEGSGLREAYGEVVSCAAHTNFASQKVQTAPDTGEEGDDTFVVAFSNCSMEEGRKFDEYLAAAKEWETYAAENGIHESAWVWWPIYGESDNEYDFKSVVAMPDHTTAGANWQAYSEGHFRKSNELFSDLLDCDVSRLYDAKVVREMADEG